MPEGDTLHRTAQTLQRVLGHERLVRSSVVAIAAAELAGHVVERVSAHGKNLLITFDDERVLHTHLRMQGSWHVYRPGERFQRPEHQARVVLEVSDAVAVCFSAPTVRLLSSGALARDPYLTGLGPDLIPAEFDQEKAVSGLEGLADLSIGEALMTQTALAGIGNIYKSETLFLCRVNPFLPVSALNRETLTRLVSTARQLLRASVHSQSAGFAVEGGRGRPWVYERSGRPCRICGAVVLMQRQGRNARSTYFCPHCQQVQKSP